MWVLILDDDLDRHVTLARRWPGAEITHVYSVSEALVALSAKPPDVLQTDHDLGKNAPDGTALARALIELPLDKRPARVLVHSWNRHGVRRMLKLLRQAGFSADWDP